MQSELEFRSETPVRAAPDGSQLVAPLWHTAIVLLVLAAVTFAGVRAHGQSTASEGRHGGIPLYLTVILSEWALFYLAFKGMRKRVHSVRDLIGLRWQGTGPFLRALAVTIAFWVVWEGVARAMHFVLGPSDTRNVNSMLPRTVAEIFVWIVLSMSAGICEEFVYRGYLQSQFVALGRSATLGILAQAVIFGGSHAYQGWKQVVIISVLGLLYGLLAHWRRSLVPGMAAHAWSDVYGGWVNP